MTDTAILALADGTIFRGTSLGVAGQTVGEVVFNTSMTGYQEILTDPSYYKQLVTLTYPHIGNVGVNDDDRESESIMAQGLIVKDCPARMSNFRAQQSLPDYLADQNVVAIADIDTRALTRILRDKGAQSGAIMAGEALTEEDEQRAVRLAQEFSGLKGLDLAQAVTTDRVYEWTEGTWSLEGGHADRSDAQRFHVVAYDYGIKHNILRMLADRGCKLTVVPAKTRVEDVLALNPDGVFLSNGPGDPQPCDYAIEAIQVLLEKRIPLFGICLGHQLLALAAGASSVKMKFGHHGANHPVQNLADRKVMITSQNHGFAVESDSLPDHVAVTHVSLFDGSLQGIRFKDQPAFSFQGHPEASPGPHDVAPLFDAFIDDMTQHQHA
ncbi:MAG: glutamine-hydrolyzing carbamoyl-phosphate synthase small subunit [Hydrogenovibrio sp.]|uniref:glutamine-hydrolyzing carbamoyl-phosphate synthase small subunit n=1 Tax=Hydrogenovibrio sp. TaxID=2065821 RepID=UPI00286FB01E|nr:glutamine-hydrolyzing carbamoyl-phosphate synthase small subunit [Hydrogenovibrio sp.]MDR9498580.1 glutamine-hydrolyzing carbamoyl-phosphate synthase small subunit [Hydrogenovibrio sp.]